MNYWEEPTDGVDAWEVVVAGTRAAWTVDNDVYVYTGDTSEREDGFVHIGVLEWVDDDTVSVSESEAANEHAFREFVLEYKKKGLR